MTEILSSGFFSSAIIACLLASILCGIVGTLVVVKRINFLSGGISHAAFGGLGVSFYLGFPPFYGAMIAGLISASLITVVNQKFKEREDALIGAVWALGMSIGIFFVFLSNRYAGDLFSFLFGDILLTTKSDLILLGIITLLVSILSTIFFSPPSGHHF